MCVSVTNIYALYNGTEPQGQPLTDCKKRIAFALTTVTIEALLPSRTLEPRQQFQRHVRSEHQSLHAFACDITVRARENNGAATAIPKARAQRTSVSACFCMCMNDITVCVCARGIKSQRACSACVCVCDFVCVCLCD